MKPHLWFERGCWWIGLGKSGVLIWNGRSPQEAWEKRQRWLSVREAAQ